MLRRRKILLGLVVGLAGVPFYATLGYAIHLRDDGYRRRYENRLIRCLRLPVSIGAVRSQTRRREDFSHIRIWLTGRRAQVFQCDRAERYALDGTGRYALVLHRGSLTVDSARWQLDDYAQVLSAAFEQDFVAMRLQYVDLHDAELVWRGGPLGFCLRGGTGRLQVEPSGGGALSLVVRSLNDVAPDARIHLLVRFDSKQIPAIREAVLTLPEMPLNALKLQPLLGGQDVKGRFEGRIGYGLENQTPRLLLSGRVGGLDLGDWTAGSNRGLVRGRVDLTVEQAEVSQKGLVRVVARGRVAHLQVAECMRWLGIPPVEGAAEVEVLGAEIADNRLVRLSASGQGTMESAEPLTRLIGPGRIAGRLRTKVNSLELKGDSVTEADIDVEVIPPEGSAASLDTELILQAARKLLGLELPALVTAPLQSLKTVTYSRLAFKLRVDREGLHVLGTHGSDGKAILTVRVFGTDLAVISQPEHPLDAGPVANRIREACRTLVQDLIPGTTTTAPSTSSAPAIGMGTDHSLQ